MDDGDKWRIKNKDKKYLKIHIAVNVDQENSFNKSN
jgi:hypothetical protein